MTPRKAYATLRAFGLSVRRSRGGIMVENLWCPDWQSAFALGVELFARRVS